jgi:mannose-6-phosphate isomerase-like protein (cupin superfamily)
MGYRVVRIADVAIGRGPHPAASPYDKRVQLDLRSFAVYQVELPAGATSQPHDHADDGVEDMYAVIAGSGTVVVDGDRVPVEPGMFVAVSPESTRHVEAAEGGVTYIAVCSTQ